MLLTVFRFLKVLFLATVLFGIAGPARTFAQAIISEFMASNTRTLADEDGDFPDWIELLNAGSTNINLNGWGLTDDPSAPRKWRFPILTLAPGEHVIVFASNKDRKDPSATLHASFRLSADEDFLGLSKPTGEIIQHFGDTYPQQLPDVSFGVATEEQRFPLVATNDAVRYVIPSDGALDEVWKSSEFADDAWFAGTNGLGFDTSGVLNGAIATDISSVAASASSVYVRYRFQAPNAEFSPLLLQAAYDDGFAAYLNGVLVAQANSPETLGWDSAALETSTNATPLKTEVFDLSGFAGLMHEGENVLAVHLLNSAPADHDLFLNTELTGYQRSISTKAWRYFVQSTPGRINGLGDTNLGPLILHAAHQPQVPTDTNSITVTAQLFPTFNPPANLTLTYRVMFGAETTVPMLDDGQHGDGAASDGVYGAVIPDIAAGPGQLVRWFLRATDTQGLSTRWPPYRDTRNSPQYLGTVIHNPSLTNNLPVLHWFMQSPTAADSLTGTRCAIFWNGTLYDNAFANLHGQSSQSFPKKSYNLDFNPGFHFQWVENETPVEDINLLTTYPDKAHIRNILAYESYRDSGHAYHFVIPVRVQRNGTFFSDAHMVEDGDADFLERVGLNPKGALYKMYNTFDSASTGVEKKTRRFEGNQDLTALLRGLQTSTGRTAFIYDNVNIPAMVNFLATMIITGNVDCCHKNYYIYRDTGITDEWQFLPWDQDLSFGRNWTSSKAYYDDTMYHQNGLFVGNNNTLPAALLNLPAIRAMYLRRVRTLMDDLMQAPGTPAAELKYEKRARELYDAIGADAALDFAKWTTWGTRQTMPQALYILTNQYFPRRRSYLFNSLANQIPRPVTNQIAISFGPLDFNPDSGTQTQEYFTLTNRTPAYVDVSGWRIEGAVEHTFAPGTVLPPSGSIYLSPDVRSFRKRTSAPRGGQALFVQGNYNGQLSARGEALGLLNTKGELVATHRYSGHPTVAQTSLRIVEIMFAPPTPGIPAVFPEDLEYVVLQNIGSAPLDLQGVHFTNGISFTFETSLILNGAEKVYVAKNPAAFSNYYGTNFLIAGPYVGQLSNSGEKLQLHDAVGENVLEFEYDRDWHALNGQSFLLSSTEISFDKFDEPNAWAASPYAGGSAGLADAWIQWRSAKFTSTEISDPILSGPDVDPDGDKASNYEEFIAGTEPKDGFSRLHAQISQQTPGWLRFPAKGGRLYTIEASSSLEPADWTTILTLPRLSGSGMVGAPLDSSPAWRFYRLRVSVE